MRQRTRCRSAVAARHRVKTDQVVLGCGSTDILRIAATAFVGSRKKIVIASPTFDWLGGFADRLGAQVVRVPLARDYSHDLLAMLARCDAATAMVYVGNPNNPTGTLTRRQDLEAFLRKLPPTIHVVIDEAYHTTSSPPPTTRRSSIARSPTRASSSHAAFRRFTDWPACASDTPSLHPIRRAACARISFPRT